MFLFKKALHGRLYKTLALDRLDSFEMLLMLELHGVAVEAETAELLSSVS